MLQHAFNMFYTYIIVYNKYLNKNFHILTIIQTSFIEMQQVEQIFAAPFHIPRDSFHGHA